MLMTLRLFLDLNAFANYHVYGLHNFHLPLPIHFCIEFRGNRLWLKVLHFPEKIFHLLVYICVSWENFK